MHQNTEQPGISRAEIMQMKSELGSEKFHHFLHDSVFPRELTQNWKDLAKKAIRSSSPLSLKITLQEFLHILEADPDSELSFFEFGCLSNSIEVISPKESEMDDDLYKATIGEAIGHIEFYQSEIKAIRTRIEIEVEKEISAKVTAMKGLDNQNGSGNSNAHLTVK